MNIYAAFEDYGVKGPLVRIAKGLDLDKARARAAKALARGAVEVEIREATRNGAERYVGTITPDYQVLECEVWQVIG